MKQGQVRDGKLMVEVDMKELLSRQRVSLHVTDNRAVHRWMFGPFAWRRRAAMALFHFGFWMLRLRPWIVFENKEEVD